MTTEPDYIVVRAAPGLPEGFVPAHLEGRWYDRSQIPLGAVNVGAFEAAGGTVGTAIAEPSGRFEVRDDGAVAEVWEIRAPD